MELLKAEPKYVLGNIALSSLIGGAATGIAIPAVVLLLELESFSPMQFASAVFISMLMAQFFIFVAGVVLVWPALAILRRLGLAGPASVYTIAIALSLTPLLEPDIRTSVVVATIALAASTVFCRLAYPAGGA